MSEPFDDLQTLDDVSRFVALSYRSAIGKGEGPLPLGVAEPGPLMERAVEIAGIDGLTRQQLLEVFRMMGAERRERGLQFLASTERVQVDQEGRPDRLGRLRKQVVYRARRADS